MPFTILLDLYGALLNTEDLSLPCLETQMHSRTQDYAVVSHSGPGSHRYFAGILETPL